MNFPNFTLPEFLASKTAHRKRIDNFPDFLAVEHLSELVSTIVQPLRDAWGSGILITSGYRCPELNKAVGGSPTSAHMLGYACDMHPVNGKFAEFALFVQDFLAKNSIPFDQLLIEQSGHSRWVHIGLRNYAGEQRRQVKNISK